MTMTQPDDYGRYYPDETKLTDLERVAWDLLVEASQAFGQLPVLHPADRGETVRDIHDLQNRILARTAYPREVREDGDAG